jgi:hypothetical protein
MSQELLINHYQEEINEYKKMIEILNHKIDE